MLKQAEKLRTDVAGLTPRAHKSAMGQFMTPAGVATFMAGLFQPREGMFRLLDAGAGLGALTCATLDRWKAGELGKGTMSVEAYELDERLRTHLEETLATYAKSANVQVKVREGDYLQQAADEVLEGRARFTHAILNPPYKKISVASDARSQARRIGLETVNLYSAFVGMALEQVADAGQLVAIIPRSFCNGPYYKPFREFMLSRAALRHIHLFDSRNKAFRDDEVLQENVIFLLEKGGAQGEVKITLSTDDSFTDLRETVLPFAQVVKPNDPEAFIHIPTEDVDAVGLSEHITFSLKDLGIGVSTGPVVDFRMREHLLKMPTADSVPLLYPAHFDGHRTTWPIEGIKKSNAIARNAATERWLFDAGTYVLVRRFSAKEEKRRIVASLVDPVALGNPERIGFENHMNVFHENKKGLPVDLAWGLYAYLNSTVVDDHLRRFSGHTQVNATDLRNIRYPSRQTLERLGEWAKLSTDLGQESIDAQMGKLL